MGFCSYIDLCALLVEGVQESSYLHFYFKITFSLKITLLICLMCSTVHMWSCLKGNIIFNSTMFAEDRVSRMKQNATCTKIYQLPHYLTPLYRALKKPRVTRQFKKIHDSMKLKVTIFAETHHTSVK